MPNVQILVHSGLSSTFESDTRYRLIATNAIGFQPARRLFYGALYEDSEWLDCTEIHSTDDIHSDEVLDSQGGPRLPHLSQFPIHETTRRSDTDGAGTSLRQACNETYMEVNRLDQTTYYGPTPYHTELWIPGDEVILAPQNSTEAGLTNTSQPFQEGISEQVSLSNSLSAPKKHPLSAPNVLFGSSTGNVSIVKVIEERDKRRRLLRRNSLRDGGGPFLTYRAQTESLEEGKKQVSTYTSCNSLLQNESVSEEWMSEREKETFLTNSCHQGSWISPPKREVAHSGDPRPQPLVSTLGNFEMTMLDTKPNPVQDILPDSPYYVSTFPSPNLTLAKQLVQSQPVLGVSEPSPLRFISTAQRLSLTPIIDRAMIKGMSQVSPRLRPPTSPGTKEIMESEAKRPSVFPVLLINDMGSPSAKGLLSQTKASLAINLQFHDEVEESRIQPTIPTHDQGEKIAMTLQDNLKIPERPGRYFTHDKFTTEDCHEEAGSLNQFVSADYDIAIGYPIEVSLQADEVDINPPFVPDFLAKLRIPSPKLKLRDIRPRERGYWCLPLIELRFTPTAANDLWLRVSEAVRNRRLYWIGLQYVSTSIRVYCFGECVMNIWTLLYVLTRQVKRGICWYDSTGIMVIRH